MARVLIAGCGDLGCRLADILTADGHEIFGIRRNVDDLPENISPIASDLFAQPPEVPDNIDYAFYIVAASSHKDIAYYQAYVLGLKNLIQSLSGQKLKRLFFVSSTSVFGQNDGEKVTEESPTEGKHFTSQRLLEGEELAFNAPFPATVIRFGGIYGPGRTHLIDLILKGKAHCMEGVYSNRIHSEDCVGIMAHLMKYDKTNSLYIGVDNEPTLTCEVYEWLADQLSVPQDIEHLEPTESSRAQRSNKRLSNAKIRATGYEFKYPSFEEGYGEMLENY
ncbi:NAD-dependent epimerase/dehydratase family protein [Hydrogenovibrio kuenenii]|uniref:NAD-dependent epimerase/dehydratase family protein n=1 Tax=Hydrogenovibrio kuenenii TaxID=63658 RepID=UPI000464443A|nr:NAD-dependent epimerase/dehydratase family protein [Hydrogenovibrio kuenenii]